MIEKETQIKELYDFKHFHDNDQNKSFDYQNKLLSKLLSNVMFRNKMTREFLNKLQTKFIWMIDSISIPRNFFNFTVGKYYDKHIN